MRIKSFAVALAAALAGASCTGGSGSQQAGPAVDGAILGNLLGRQAGSETDGIWSSGTGAVLEGIAESDAGTAMSRDDEIYMTRTTQAALEHTKSGQSSTWLNPNTGNTGSVTPVKTFQRDDDTYCRTIEQTLTTNDGTARARGTACRQPNGTWQIQ